jgi:hypothetical protein
MPTKSKRTEIRLSEKEKAKLEDYAARCGLPLSEYLRQRGLGYEPRPLLPDEFYRFYSQLCDLCNYPMSAGVEAALLELIIDIRRELMLPKKQSKKEVVAWLQQDSGQSKDG